MTDLETQEPEGTSPVRYLSLVFLVVLVGTFGFLLFTQSN